MTTTAPPLSPERLEFMRSRFAKMRVLTDAHYFRPVMGGDWAPPATEPLETYCGEWIVRRTGKDVPADICPACVDAVHAANSVRLVRLPAGVEGPFQLVPVPPAERAPVEASGPVA
jgi:hypothetical protein